MPELFENLEPSSPKPPVAGEETKPAVIPIRWRYGIAMAVCAYLLVRGVLFGGPGISIFVFTAAFCAVAFLYLRTEGHKPAHASYAYLALVMLYAASLALYENTEVRWFLLCLVLLGIPYWLYCAAGKRQPDFAGAGMLPDALIAGAFVPLMSIPPVLRGMRATGEGRKALQVLAGVLISVPILGIATALLIQADAGFEALVVGFIETYLEDGPAIFARVVLTVLLAVYLLALLYGIVQAKARPRPERAAKWQLPVLLSGVLLLLLGVLYALFCALQVQSVAGMLVGNVPEGFMYSEYARTGFFELCIVACMNLLIYMGVQRFTDKKPVGTRILLSFLGVLTLGLIAVACLKMWLYMQAYGLTLLRVYTTWFMLTVFVLFVMLIIAQWSRLRLGRAMVIACLASSLLLGYVNVPGFVTRVNVAQYSAGTLAELDTEQYADFPYEAITQLLPLYDVEDGKIALNREIMRLAKQVRADADAPFYTKSIQRIVAEGQAEAFLEAQD